MEDRDVPCRDLWLSVTYKEYLFFIRNWSLLIHSFVTYVDLRRTVNDNYIKGKILRKRPWIDDLDKGVSGNPSVRWVQVTIWETNWFPSIRNCGECILLSTLDCRHPPNHGFFTEGVTREPERKSEDFHPPQLLSPFLPSKRLTNRD